MLKKSITWFEKYYIISLIIAIIIAIFIFYLSSIPSSGYPVGLGIMTKVYHIVIFSLLSFFLILAMVRGKTEDKYYIFIAILLSMLYSTSDEIHQSFVPGRNPAFTDVMIDSIGILIAGIIYSIRIKIKGLFSIPQF